MKRQGPEDGDHGEMKDGSFVAIQEVRALWRYSPILRAAIRTLNYLATHGPIGLTSARALPPDFVQWAAEVFEWPGYGLADLYADGIEIHEHDFLPLAVLHDLMLSTRLARHRQGCLAITRLGRASVGDPARLWEILLTELLFRTDHARYAGQPYQFSGDWDLILQIMHFEVHQGASEARICAALFNVSEADVGRDNVVRSTIKLHVLRPLVWSGLLAEIATGGTAARERIYVKTPLWDAALGGAGSGYCLTAAVH